MFVPDPLFVSRSMGVDIGSAKNLNRSIAYFVIGDIFRGRIKP